MKGGKKPPTDRSSRAGNKEDNIVPDNLRPSDQIQLENERVVDVVFSTIIYRLIIPTLWATLQLSRVERRTSN
jgi:hypothetical protein